MKTLTEVAETMALGKVMKDPERYLVRQIKSGRIRARKVGRAWMMTDADIEFALDQFGARPPAPVADPDPTGQPSARSLRRRQVA